MDDKGCAELRDDILLFPELDFLDPSLKQTIRTAMISLGMRRALELFKAEFGTEHEVMTYVNSFVDPKDAEAFLRFSSFIIPSKGSKPDIVGLIMIISAIERLSRPDYIRFNEWLQTGEATELLRAELASSPILDPKQFMETFKKLSSRHSERTRHRRGFRAFLDELLTTEQKILILRGIRSKLDESVERHYKDILTFERQLEVLPFDHLVPGCFEYVPCWTGYEFCLGPDECRLKDDPQALSREFGVVADLLYDIRSQFVHAASLMAFIPRQREGAPMNYLGIVNRSVISIDLKLETLEEMVVSRVKLHFDQKPRIHRRAQRCA